MTWYMPIVTRARLAANRPDLVPRHQVGHEVQGFVLADREQIGRHVLLDAEEAVPPDARFDQLRRHKVSGQTEHGAIRSATGTARSVRPGDYPVAGKPHAVGAREP